jgi:hypothetical protein
MVREPFSHACFLSVAAKRLQLYKKILTLQTFLAWHNFYVLLPIKFLQMPDWLRALIAGYGAKKLGGGCLSTIVIFFILYWLLGHGCGHYHY